MALGIISVLAIARSTPPAALEFRAFAATLVPHVNTGGHNGLGSPLRLGSRRCCPTGGGNGGSSFFALPIFWATTLKALGVMSVLSVACSTPVAALECRLIAATFTPLVNTGGYAGLCSPLRFGCGFLGQCRFTANAVNRV